MIDEDFDDDEGASDPKTPYQRPFIPKEPRAWDARGQPIGEFVPERAFGAAAARIAQQVPHLAGREGEIEKFLRSIEYLFDNAEREFLGKRATADEYARTKRNNPIYEKAKVNPLAEDLVSRLAFGRGGSTDWLSANVHDPNYRRITIKPFAAIQPSIDDFCLREGFPRRQNKDGKSVWGKERKLFSVEVGQTFWPPFNEDHWTNFQKTERDRETRAKRASDKKV